MLRMDVYAYSATDAREPRSDETEAEPSYGETLNALGDAIAAGLDCLYALTSTPRHLVREGENLAAQTRRAPDNEPPRNLLQSVLAWVKTICQWLGQRLQRLGQPPSAQDVDNVYRRVGDLERRCDNLERRVNALAATVQGLVDELRDFRQEVRGQFDRVQGQFGQVQSQFDQVQSQFDQVQIQFKETRRELHAHIEAVEGRLGARIDSMHKDLALTERANAEGRAEVIEKTLRRWALSEPTWLSIMTNGTDTMWRVDAIDELWNDHIPAQFWPALAQRLNLPDDSPVRRCDLVARVRMTSQDASLEFLLVGEASVHMGTNRIDKAIQAAQNLRGCSINAPVLPCVCAREYPQGTLAYARARRVLPLQWDMAGAPLLLGPVSDIQDRLHPRP